MITEVHSDPKNHNVFYKKIKCKVKLCNIASVQYNYLWIIASNNWLKCILNITEYMSEKLQGMQI